MECIHINSKNFTKKHYTFLQLSQEVPFSSEQVCQNYMAWNHDKHAQHANMEPTQCCHHIARSIKEKCKIKHLLANSQNRG